MKKFAVSIILVACMVGSMNLFAQKNKPFAGIIKFSMKYEGDIDPQTRSYLPTESNYTIYGNMVKTSINLGAFYQHLIYTPDSLLVLFDIPGYRFYLTTSKSEQEEANMATKYTITPSDETKTICGYVCQRYDIISYNIEDDKETKSTVYVTDQIGEDEGINFWSIPGLKGYPLYTEQELENMKIIIEATEVAKKKIKYAEFLLPMGYIYMTKEEYRELMKKGE